METALIIAKVLFYITKFIIAGIIAAWAGHVALDILNNLKFSPENDEIA